MRAIYMSRCTKTEAELQAALEAETYLSADEALDWGFATDVVVAQQAAALRPDRGRRRGARTPRARRAPAAPSRTPSEAKLRDAGALIDDVLGTIGEQARVEAPPALGDAPTTMDNKAMASLLTAARRH